MILASFIYRRAKYEKQLMTEEWNYENFCFRPGNLLSASWPHLMFLFISLPLLGMKFSLISIDFKLTRLLRPSLNSTSEWGLGQPSPHWFLNLGSSHSSTFWAPIFPPFITRLVICTHMWKFIPNQGCALRYFVFPSMPLTWMDSLATVILSNSEIPWF